MRGGRGDVAWIEPSQRTCIEARQSRPEGARVRAGRGARAQSVPARPSPGRCRSGREATTTSARSTGSQRSGSPRARAIRSSTIPCATREFRLDLLDVRQSRGRVPAHRVLPRHVRARRDDLEDVAELVGHLRRVISPRHGEPLASIVLVRLAHTSHATRKAPKVPEVGRLGGTGGAAALHPVTPLAPSRRSGARAERGRNEAHPYSSPYERVEPGARSL